MAMSKALLRKMVKEVSDPTLGGLLADYSGRIAEREVVGTDTIEDVAAIELILAEMKTRGGVKSESRRSKPVEQPPIVIGNNGGATHEVRSEGGQLQR